ncbi:hypothetical protein CIK05_13740 [Bdellovibrio sp. qaytius]|nr:hypothetical protein CIK05_13740 [Bdellovibrio sp. qaytius]
MNFTRVSMLFLGAVLVGLMGCKPASPEAPASGDISVQIPLSENNGDINNSDASYGLKTVTLKNIETLREVRGQYARFFLAPGLVEGQLNGASPIAYFAKTKDQTYIAKDVVSLQMATIYYHMQNLITWAQDLGVSIKSPMPVGINTKIKGDEALQNNNAFYDGRSKAMLFVPYTSDEMPISVNAGIIAHEFFHSIFFNKVLGPISQKQKATSQRISDLTVHSYEGWSKQKTFIQLDLSEEELFNETYIRGINEGLADYWGWAYTNDPDFLKWSLSSHAKKRTLTKQAQVSYKSDRDIEAAVVEAKNIGDDPSMALSNYIYDIGTPYARFLKELVYIKMQHSNISLADAKRQVNVFVIGFVQDLAKSALKLKTKDKLSTQDLFLAVDEHDSGLQSKEQCELIIQYLNAPLEKADVIAAKYTCAKDFEAYKVIKP